MSSGGNKNVNAVCDDGVQYKSAKMWRLALTAMTGAGQMAFYMLMTSATYIGNANFGILVAVTGIIITASRLLDGVTDPIIALIMERFNSRFGKVRFFTLLGWAVMSLATTLMCNIGPKFNLTGAAGLVFFIVAYAIYIIGYTFVSIAGAINGQIITNDPKQRPVISVWNTAYSYLAPMIMSVVSMAIILPKYDNVQDTPYFGELNIVVICVSLFFYILSCIGVSEADVPESYESLNKKEEEAKPSLKDMVSLIKSNKELQRYIVAASSDKLAQTVGSAAVVTTMLYGIIIGSMALSSILSAVSMLPSIIFAIVGAKIAGKKGNRELMVKGTWACIIVNVLYAVFLIFAPLTEAGAVFNQTSTNMVLGGIMAGLFMLFNFANSSVKMMVSVATSSMRMDVVDYEMDRTGKYMPATVSATYSFIDKVISAFGATIATAFIAIIGYTTSTPQQGDPLTWGVKICTAILLIGFPILGWICTLCAMKNCTLTREKMVEVQKNIADKKAALIAAGQTE